jgi:hypothetical protein
MSLRPHAREVGAPHQPQQRFEERLRSISALAKTIGLDGLARLIEGQILLGQDALGAEYHFHVVEPLSFRVSQRVCVELARSWRSSSSASMPSRQLRMRFASARENSSSLTVVPVLPRCLLERIRRPVQDSSSRPSCRLRCIREQ